LKDAKNKPIIVNPKPFLEIILEETFKEINANGNLNKKRFTALKQLASEGKFNQPTELEKILTSFEEDENN
jgi:hypothetical protein